MTGHADDVRLLHLVAAGDREARRALVHRIHRRMETICRRVLGSGPDAEDAMQQSMLKILHHAASFQGAGSLESWTDQITARTAVRASRSRAHHARASDPDIDPEALAAASAGPGFGDQLPRPLRAYLEQLPEAMARALVLRNALGYAVEEVAALEGVSPNTIKDRLVRGRRAVRKLIHRDQAIGVRRAGAPS